jgi:4-hydroxy-3-polyprenylbenzoate decarboxylase
LRDFLLRTGEAGELKRITAEVDLEEEMAAIVYMAHREIGAPALLFERVKGYPTGVLWNMLGSSTKRVAIAMGLPTEVTVKELIQAARARLKRGIPPVVIESDKAPVYRNTLRGDEVDVTLFPAPKHWPLDGGRYIGTADAVITRDPERGHLNVGTYRMMVHDRNHVGLYCSPGKDARLHLEAWWQAGKPCEIAAVWGVDPTTFVVAALTMPKTESEFQYIGGIRGEPVELVKGDVTDLLFPAHAELVIEGAIRPGDYQTEGPFGEFTGYYGRPQGDAFRVEVKAIHFKDNPILTAALMADYWPSNEQALFFSIFRSARIWDDLDRLGIPGIKGVYVHPAAAGGFAMNIVSLEQRYAGHAPQVLALAAQCPSGAYFSKWVVAVDEDVDPTDINQVLWAMATRCNPAEDIDILKNTWSTWLDPTQNPPEERPYGSKALINACKEHRYVDVFSPRSKLRKSMYERVQSRWRELGFSDQPPDISDLEQDSG